MLDAVLSYIKRIYRYITRKSSNILVLREVTFKPTAIMDVSAAPVVRLLSNSGQILSESDIRVESFKHTSATWTENYSVVYPSSEEWERFWMVYKDIL